MCAGRSVVDDELVQLGRESVVEQVGDQVLVERPVPAGIGPTREPLPERVGEQAGALGQGEDVGVTDKQVRARVPDRPGLDKPSPEDPSLKGHSVGKERVAHGEVGEGRGEGAFRFSQEAH